MDPLVHGPILDMFMGSGSGGGGSAMDIFQDLKRKAEEARAQAQAQNPGAQLPPIDYAGLMQKASQIAAGAPPEATIEPGRAQEAADHMQALGMAPGETAGMPDRGPGGGGGLWSRIGSNFEGESVPADAARRARLKGLTDAGLALLSSAGEGDLGRGLAGGLSAFKGGMDRELEGFTARRRQTEADDLRRRQVEESLGASREARQRARAGEARDVASFEQKQGDREAVLSAMDEQVRAIEGLAGADSPEADRAHALRRGGPALQDDLDKLHQQLIARKRFPEDQAMETDAEIAKRKRIFAEDPEASWRRGVEERRLDLYNTRAGGSTTGNDITATSMLSYLNRKSEDEFELLLLEKYGATAFAAYKKFGMLPGGADLSALQDQAEQRAFDALERNRGKIRGLRGGGGEEVSGGEGGGSPGDDAILATARAALARKPGMSTEELRRRLLEEVGGDEKRAERLLVMLSGM